MSTLNRVGAEVAHNFTVHACTDVTGFSLMGHSVEMASASDVTIHIKAYDILSLMMSSSGSRWD